MNERFHLDMVWPATTQAADGMPRRPWTVAEIEAMVAAGIIDQDERFELIGGEVVPMSPRGARHEMVKGDLNEHFQGVRPRDMRVMQETTLRLDENSFVEPDFCVFPRTIAPGDVRGHDVLLAIEIADTSLRYDLGRKIGIYAAFGIPEIWVTNANTLVTHVHRALGVDGYRTVFEARPTDEIVSVRVPELKLCLSALGLKPL
ncbi:Uma2 family endonuclease [Mesorhizobium sp. IMUNJ 23232]|uniref:Uma2 family endonuclease n=1 Tax=Mesorhizobium sp. IMUNJ 23232 TaxID=3376064 RepID=UPI00378942BC